MKYKRWLSLYIYTFSSFKRSPPVRKRKEKKRGLDFFLAILKLRSYWFLNIISKMVFFFKKITFI